MKCSNKIVYVVTSLRPTTIDIYENLYVHRFIPHHPSVKKNIFKFSKNLIFAFQIEIDQLCVSVSCNLLPISQYKYSFQ